jgi:phospholipid/cholesterol/gamma-HCH transport system ATP-binding protein
MIEFKNVIYSIREKTILRDVSFSIADGEMVLLMGNSGVGKSTILKLILGLLKPVSGSIKLFGTDFTSISENELMKLRQKCGIVFQEGALFDSLTVAENTGFFMHDQLKMPVDEVQERVNATLRKLNLEQFLYYYPSQLSGGMKKRAAIARAIAHNPGLLLYDEPTAGLDFYTARKVIDIIATLKKQNAVTSLIVSHELHYFFGIIDRLLLLKNGLIVYDDIPEMMDFNTNYKEIINIYEKYSLQENGIIKEPYKRL